MASKNTHDNDGGGLIAKDENLELIYGFRHIKWNDLQNPGKAGQNSLATAGINNTKPCLLTTGSL